MGRKLGAKNEKKNGMIINREALEEKKERSVE